MSKKIKSEYFPSFPDTWVTAAQLADQIITNALSSYKENIRCDAEMEFFRKGHKYLKSTPPQEK